MQTAMKHDKQADLIKNKDEIKEMLRLEIVSRYYYTKGRLEAALVNDPDLSKAIELIGSDEYHSILNPDITKSN